MRGGAAGGWRAGGTRGVRRNPGRLGGGREADAGGGPAGRAGGTRCVRQKNVRDPDDAVSKYSEQRKAEEWERQQAVLAERRARSRGQGGGASAAKERRAAVQAEIRAEREEIKAARREGRNLKNKKRIEEEYEDEPAKSIPIPMISIGMPEYDGGERFDLKAPYTDEGYVAEDGGFSWLNLLYIPLVGGLGFGIYLTLSALGG